MRIVRKGMSIQRVEWWHSRTDKPIEFLQHGPRNQYVRIKHSLPAVEHYHTDDFKKSDL